MCEFWRSAEAVQLIIAISDDCGSLLNLGYEISKIVLASLLMLAMVAEVKEAIFY